MTPQFPNSPTIFDTTHVAPDEPLLQRPFSPLPLDLLVEAARIVTAYPNVPAIQRYRMHVVTLRIAAAELEQLLESRANLRAKELANAPAHMHAS